MSADQIRKEPQAPHRYKLDAYDYSLPKRLIAHFPTKRRTDARLLYLKQREMIDSRTRLLPNLLRAGDVLVLNNTKVLPARLEAQKETGGKAEVLLNRFFAPKEAEAIIRSSRAPKPGEKLFLTQSAAVQMKVLRRENEFFILQLLGDIEDFRLVCKKYGKLPLPSYINRAPRPADYRRYQTSFAKRSGAVAAPTAGLHLSQSLLNEIRKRGVETTELTLHTGAATFTPLRTDDIRLHKMHYEWCQLSTATADCLNLAKRQGRRIVAVGTTSLRALETAWQGKEFAAYTGWTNLFIYPGNFPIRTADLLLTNFHLARSSLLLLVCAFGGTKPILDAYAYAITQEYRFFSYGDAMLIEREGLED